MKIDFKQEIKDLLTGEPLKNREGHIQTLERVCIIGLHNNPPGKEITKAEKVDRYRISIKVIDGVELEAEETGLIKTLIDQAGFGPAIVGPAFEMLEGKYKERVKKEELKEK